MTTLTDMRRKPHHALLLMLLATTLQATETYYPKPDAQGGWRTSTKGVNREKLDQAFEYASRTSQHGGLLVVRHGYLVYERYYGRGNREAIPTMASVGKSFTSVACGIMLSEYKAKFPLGLNTKVFTADYLPEALPLDDPRKADITLGQLLSMAAGLHGDGANPGFIDFEPRVKLEPAPVTGSQDEIALHTPLWIAPGGGYSYSSQSPHIASIVLRHATGMEMQQYIDSKIAKPLGWGDWGYAIMQHTPGGGSIAARSTDALRFAYMLLHNGQWGQQQLVPADYVAALSHPSPYQKHAPLSLMFEVNSDGHVAGAPKDAYFKSGAGGFGIYVIPSLDMVIYKMAGNDQQYDPKATGLKQNYAYDGKRDNWKPAQHTQFSDGPIGVDDGVRRTLEMVVAAATD